MGREIYINDPFIPIPVLEPHVVRETIGDSPFNGERVEFALTQKQRQAILERDGYTSQLRHYSEEKGFHKEPNCIYDGKPCPHLQVNHILNQREAYAKGIDPDTPENLITLKECEHLGRCPSNRIKN